MPALATTLPLVLHELSHGIASLFDGHQTDFAITQGECETICWNRQPHSSEMMRLAVAAAGPMADMLGKKIIKADSKVSDILAAFSKFIAADDATSPDSDAERIRHLRRSLPGDESGNAVLMGLKAAQVAYRAFAASPSHFIVLAERIDKLTDDEALIVDNAAIQALLRGSYATIRCRNFTDWLTQGADLNALAKGQEFSIGDFSGQF